MSADVDAEDAGLLKVAVIGAGAGHALRRLYPCLPRLPIDLVGVCDLDEAQARRVARRFGARAAYTDYTTMLSEAELDAVIVCIGPDQHRTISIDVMEAGLPVYTEKPPAVTAAGARTVLEASQRTGQHCMTAFCKRFAPAYVKAHAGAHAPEFGTPSLLTMSWSYGPTLYTGREADPRWAFMLDFGTHALDSARYLVGEVAEVHARKQPDGSSWAISLSFANGAMGLLGMSDHRSALTERVELIGAAGNTIEISRRTRMVQYRDGDVVAWHEKPPAIADSLIESGYQGELEAFVAAVQGKREPASSIASAYETMRLHDAVLLSAAERRTVALDEIA